MNASGRSCITSMQAVGKPAGIANLHRPAGFFKHKRQAI